MTSTNRTLVIMAKAPREGSVKTRLAGKLSLPAVTELYRCLLNDTVDLAQSLNQVELAIMCPAADLEDLSCVIGNAAHIVAQTGQGLAAGLSSVFAKFTTAERRRVIAFNADSPHLPAFVLIAAFDALERCDLVVGPTHDGGYFLVGAVASHPGLFANDGLGTSSALDGLLGRARSLGLSVHLTDPFYDIDVAADLTRLAEELRRVPKKAPRTAQWLSEWIAAEANPNQNQGCP